MAEVKFLLKKKREHTALKDWAKPHIYPLVPADSHDDGLSQMAQCLTHSHIACHISM